jgi:hypothetical protein
VGSSDYPIFHANLNSGDSLYVPGDTEVALNKVYHEPGATSAVLYRTRLSGGINDQETDRRIGSRPVIICRGSFILEFQLARASGVELKVFDAAGREIASRAETNPRLGKQRLAFDLSPFSRGIYFACLAIGDRPVAVTKIVNISE